MCDERISSSFVSRACLNTVVEPGGEEKDWFLEQLRSSPRWETRCARVRGAARSLTIALTKCVDDHVNQMVPAPRDAVLGKFCLAAARNPKRAENFKTP